ncbi:bifunctional riboflavin kinase/FAD synthetase [Paenibacillus sp. GP183]|uniref:bifunctional riboflavin kinase/FAD synthetase n=1 Tax=Paenibacillus sp. GP183 TaxID=1882751 RepID=UPI0008957748|nr:bifunctional riboflavin kinase/FAD synthetase [Paenibacillus sp. GP183]SEB47637.1 riboflavin kinase / FMN adenylyltransferase [Paenibacillus sp. GP183]
MEIVQLSYPLNDHSTGILPVKQVIAIGDFDGVHLGHREVIGRALYTAEQLHLPASIMTFDPHPRVVLGHDKYKELLTPLHKRMELFEQMGVSYVYAVHFDTALMRLSPEHFVNEILLPIGVDSVIVGFDFHFGYQGKGNPDTLCELSHGKFAVEVVRPYYIDGAKVSSTLIREALVSGQVDVATRLLGRRYNVRGKVVSGDRRGRTIGFPTANLELDEAYIKPLNGVYAVKAQVKGLNYDAVMNVGVKPTFAASEPKPSWEVHLFDFEDQIYGETVTVELVEFLREERKFTSIDMLVAQIKQDAEEAKAKLSHL